MLRAYLQVFRIRGLSVPLLTSFAGSLPIGMLNLSVLLLIRLHGQSFGAAGIVAGALNLGSGAGLVAQGAWIDRRGQSGVLAAAGLACAASLAALAAVVAGGGPAWLIAALAGIAVGNLVGGALAGDSVRPVFMAAAGGAVVATAWAALRKHTLPGPREEHDPTRQP